MAAVERRSSNLRRCQCCQQQICNMPLMLIVLLASSISWECCCAAGSSRLMMMPIGANVSQNGGISRGTTTAATLEETHPVAPQVLRSRSRNLLGPAPTPCPSPPPPPRNPGLPSSPHSPLPPTLVEQLGAQTGLGSFSLSTGPVTVTSNLADSMQSLYILTSITIIVNLCGHNNPDTISSLTNRWWGYNKGSTTLQEYWQQCSMGKVTMDSARNIIVGPMTLGCSGTSLNGLAWNANACGYSDIFGIVEVAEKWAKGQGHDLTKYTHTILSLPSGAVCGSSWGVQGCVGNGRCAVLMTGGIANTGLDPLMHELGHNLNLQHAAKDGVEYADVSDLMGRYSGQHCYTAPSMWTAGWARPISGGDLTESNFPTGQWRTFNLPELATSASNHIRFNYNSYASWFISFRSPVGYDKGLFSDQQNKIFLHRYAGENRMGRTTKPNLLDVQGLGQQSKRADSKLVITPLQMTSQSAIVAVCRWSNSVNECSGLGGVVVRL